ncbi:hypothetical protein AB0M20_35175 [Actinoplanes sp. NPDC051633]|uniref:hypothetical protein n=1 Tax=Actinoplanes sp. NPDC051633 TaxID=3155670 RepID=UPI00342C005C
MSGDDRLRTELRDLADGYRPDRATITTRAAAGRAAAARRDRMRPIAAAGAVLGVVAAIAVGVHVNDEPDPPVVAAVAPTAPTSTPAMPEPDATKPDPTKPDEATPTATRPTPQGPAGSGRSFMTCVGSVDENSVPTWTQNTVTVRTSERTTAVAVTITVPRAAGTREAGKFSTVPNSDLAMTVEQTADALLYHFRLVEGAQLPPGRWVFAAQFEHAAGRDRARDSYVVDARASGEKGLWNGDFSGT